MIHIDVTEPNSTITGGVELDSAKISNECADTEEYSYEAEYEEMLRRIENLKFSDDILEDDSDEYGEEDEDHSCYGYDVDSDSEELYGYYSDGDIIDPDTLNMDY